MQDRLPVHGMSHDAELAIKAWAMAVHSEAGNGRGDSSEPEVVLCVTVNEAVVLDEFLRRYSDSDVFATEHPAEQQALWNLQCILERNGNRPNWPTLEVARRALS